MNTYIQQVNEFIQYNSDLSCFVLFFVCNGTMLLALFKLTAFLKESEGHYIIRFVSQSHRVQPGIPTWLII